MNTENRGNTNVKVLRPDINTKAETKSEVKLDVKPDAKPEPKADPKVTPQAQAGTVSQKELIRKKLETVRGKLTGIAAEITKKEKSGEPIGILLLQKRSLRSWEARFTRRLQAVP